MVQRLLIRAVMTVIGMIATTVVAAIAAVTTTVAIPVAAAATTTRLATRLAVVMTRCKVTRTTAPIARRSGLPAAAASRRLIYVMLVTV